MRYKGWTITKHNIPVYETIDEHGITRHAPLTLKEAKAFIDEENTTCHHDRIFLGKCKACGNWIRFHKVDPHAEQVMEDVMKLGEKMRKRRAK